MSVEYFFFINVLLPTLSCPFFFFLQKRRSNRQVKRKKYAEELEARLSDDEVKVIVKTKKTNTAASKQPALQLFVVSSSANSSVVAQKGQFAFVLVCFFWENQRAKRLKPHRVHCIAFKSQFYKVSGSSQTTDHAKDCFFFVFFSGNHAHKLSRRAHLCTGKNKKHILERNNSTTCEVKNSTACSVHHRAVTRKPGPLQYACT